MKHIMTVDRTLKRATMAKAEVDLLWRLRARWSLLDVVQSVSQTKSDCLSAFLIDSVIFIFFSCEYCAFYIFYHLFLCPGTGRFVRNRRRDFWQLNVAIPRVVFFLRLYKFSCLLKI